jgi:AcrR family transcriptional regulator
VNYHFGSKHEFIRAVIKRRVESINARRLSVLGAAERRAGGAPVPANKTLEAFFGPAVEDFNGRFQSFLWIGPAGNPYREYFISLMIPVLDRFSLALRRSSARSDEDCLWYVYFSLAILAFMLAGPPLSSGLSTSLGSRTNARAIKRRIVQLLCGGFNGHAA